MDRVGRSFGELVDPAVTPVAQGFNYNFYDGADVFRQIGAYRGEAEPWTTYANRALDAYADGYLVPNNFVVTGYFRFSGGLYKDFLAGRRMKLADLAKIRDNPALSRLAEYRGDYAGTLQAMSRELAYALEANINAERAGLPRVVEDGRPRPETIVRWMATHFQTWESANYDPIDTNRDLARMAPFMAGLSAEALIDFIEWEEAHGRNPNAAWAGAYGADIETGLERFFLWMRDQSKVRTGDLAGQPMWMTEGGVSTFRYEDKGGGAATPGWELGNLVGYPYAWLAVRKLKKDPTKVAEANRLMQIADELFIGTTAKAWVAAGKFFNQEYRSSMKYMRLRESSGLGLCNAAGQPRSPSSVNVN